MRSVLLASALSVNCSKSNNSKFEHLFTISSSERNNPGIDKSKFLRVPDDDEKVLGFMTLLEHTIAAYLIPHRQTFWSHPVAYLSCLRNKGEKIKVQVLLAIQHLKVISTICSFRSLFLSLSRSFSHCVPSKKLTCARKNLGWPSGH